MKDQPLQLSVGKAATAMDWLQWSASVIGSLAWPLAFILFCLIFRRPLARLIGKLKKASFAGGMIETTLDAGEAQMDATEAAAPPNKWERAAASGMALDEMPPHLSPAVQKRRIEHEVITEQAIRNSPAEAVEEIWRAVETAVRDAARRLGAPTQDISKPIFALGKILKGQELFTSQMMVMLAELRKVRILAAHAEEDVTSEAATRYFHLAARLIALLDVL